MVLRYIVGILLVATALAFAIGPGPPDEQNSGLVSIAWLMPFAIAFAMPRFKLIAALTPYLVYLMFFGPDQHATTEQFGEDQRWLFMVAFGLGFQVVLALLGSYFSMDIDNRERSADSSP